MAKGKQEFLENLRNLGRLCAIMTDFTEDREPKVATIYRETKEAVEVAITVASLGDWEAVRDRVIKLADDLEDCDHDGSRASQVTLLLAKNLRDAAA